MEKIASKIYFGGKNFKDSSSCKLCLHLHFSCIFMFFFYIYYFSFRFFNVRIKNVGREWISYTTEIMLVVTSLETALKLKFLTIPPSIVPSSPAYSALLTPPRSPSSHTGDSAFSIIAPKPKCLPTSVRFLPGKCNGAGKNPDSPNQCRIIPCPARDRTSALPLLSQTRYRSAVLAGGYFGCSRTYVRSKISKCLNSHREFDPN